MTARFQPKIKTIEEHPFVNVWHDSRYDDCPNKTTGFMTEDEARSGAEAVIAASNGEVKSVSTFSQIGVTAAKQIVEYHTTNKQEN